MRSNASFYFEANCLLPAWAESQIRMQRTTSGLLSYTGAAAAVTSRARLLIDPGARHGDGEIAHPLNDARPAR